MKIECQSCGAQHDLDPPSWVLSSGRPFRFRCSVCGHSQMVEPPRATIDGGVTQPAGATPPRTSITRPPGATPASPPREGRASAPMFREAPSYREELAVPPASAPAGIYLRQEGKVYLVKDWATLQRWIMERRVAREDDVSEDGARWDTVGGRPELGSFFAAVEALEAAEIAGLRGAPPAEPTHERPYSGSALARLDDETEGVPLGLPQLPTEDLDPEEAPAPAEESWPAQPPSRLAPASPADDDVPALPSAVLPDEPSISDAPDPAWDEPLVEQVESPALSMPFFAESDRDPIDAPSLPPEEPAVVAPLPPAPTLIPDPELDDPFNEPSVPLEESPSLMPGGSPEPTPVRAQTPPVTSFGDFDDLLPPKPSDEPTEERPSDEAPIDPAASPHLEDDDLADPFGAFEDAAVEADVAPVPPPRRPGPPGWLWVTAAIILTSAAVLGVYVAYARGWMGPSSTPVESEPPPAPASAPPSVPPTEVVPPTEAPPLEPASGIVPDTDAPGSDVPVTAVSVEAPKPPVEAPKPPVEAPKPPVEAPKPPVEAPKPPVEAPKPAPKPAAPSVSQLRERGWKALDRGDTSAAVDTFEKATVASPADAESWYGLGYARNAAGQAEAARTALCKASTLAKGPMKAEIERILLRDQMACP